MHCNNASPIGNESRKYFRLLLPDPVLPQYRAVHSQNRTAWMLAPSAICTHQQGELLSKGFHMKLQMLPIAFQCELCPALRSCQRWWIRRHYVSLLLATKGIVPVITRQIPDSQLGGETGFKVMALNRLPFPSTERFSLPSANKPGYYKTCEHFKSFHWNTRTSAICILGSKVVK